MGPFRRTAVATLALLALTAALAGCARDTTVVDGVGVAAPQPEGTGDVDRALAAWKDFPAGRHPRPIVLIGPVAVQYAGYTTSDAKEAAMQGLYRLDVPLPPDPPATAVTLPDGPATVPVIGAAAAVDLMKADAGESKGGSVAPLAIVGFEFATEALPTDRGTVTLPVWRVHTADELGPTVVLAVADSALARPATTQSTSVGTAMPGGNTATVDATGGAGVGHRDRRRIHGHPDRYRAGFRRLPALPAAQAGHLPGRPRGSPGRPGPAERAGPTDGGDYRLSAETTSAATSSGVRPSVFTVTAATSS
jgi:hypothetical protein